MDPSQDKSISTPAFIFDEKILLNSLNILEALCSQLDMKLLYSMKSFSSPKLIKIISNKVEGFSASSLYEAKLAKDYSHENNKIHLTYPGMKIQEWNQISSLCDYVSFNSFSQMERMYKENGRSPNLGLRINPQMSFAADEGYDPCRENSKLGVPLDQISTIIDSNPNLAKAIRGLHIHANAEEESLRPLQKQVEKIINELGDLLPQIEWFNLGGGYLYHKIKNIEPLYNIIQKLRMYSNMDIFIEPGEEIIGNSGKLLSSVVDIFKSGSKTVAILDTSINHMPEVFEYRYSPEVFGSSQKGNFEYILAGSSCLAGDIFGEYKFEKPIEIGSQVIFERMGAYSLVKAHMFNGISLPSVYIMRMNRELEELKKFTYHDFVTRWEVLSIEGD